MSGDGLEEWEAEQERIAERQSKISAEHERQKLMFEKQFAEGTLVIGLPGGKSLKERTEELLSNARIRLRREHPRSVVSEVTGLSGVTSACEFKANQIPTAVAKGIVAFGITGNDNVHEYSEYDARLELKIERIVVCAELPYSRKTSGPTKAVLFTRSDNPVNEASGICRRDEVATEYPSATIKLLFSQGVQGANIIECTGSAESLVVSGACKYGVALTETGDTLRANGLKVIGTIFESNTVLIANKAALECEGIQTLAQFLARKLTGVLDARDKVYLLMNAPAGKVGEISEYLEKVGATLRKPTVAPLFNGSMFCSVATVVRAIDLNAVEMQLGLMGAEGFVELDPTVIM